MGRCNVAPTVCVGKNYVDVANFDKVKKTIDEKNFDPFIPDYINLSSYKKNGGYEIANKIKNGVISKNKFWIH